MNQPTWGMFFRDLIVVCFEMLLSLNRDDILSALRIPKVEEIGWHGAGIPPICLVRPSVSGARIAIGRALLTRWGFREAGPASEGLSETLQYEVAFSGAVR